MTILLRRRKPCLVDVGVEQPAAGKRPADIRPFAVDAASAFAGRAMPAPGDPSASCSSGASIDIVLQHWLHEPHDRPLRCLAAAISAIGKFDRGFVGEFACVQAREVVELHDASPSLTETIARRSTTAPRIDAASPAPFRVTARWMVAKGVLCCRASDSTTAASRAIASTSPPVLRHRQTLRRPCRRDRSRP